MQLKYYFLISFLLFFADFATGLNASDLLQGRKAAYYQQCVADTALDNLSKLAAIDSLLQMTSASESWSLLEHKGRLKEQLGSYQQAADLYDSCLHAPLLALPQRLSLLYRLGEMDFYLSRYNRSIAHGLEMLETEKPDSLRHWDLYADMLLANLFMRMSKVELSTRYIDHARRLLGEIRLDEVHLRQVNFLLYNNSAAICVLRRDYGQAFHYYDTARVYASSAIDHLRIDDNYAILYAILDEPVIAEKLFRDLVDRDSTSYYYVVAVNNYANFLYHHRRFDDALQMAGRGAYMSNLMQLDHVKSNALSIESDVYRGMGQHAQAYDRLLESKQIADSLFNEEFELQMMEMLQEYETNRLTYEKEQLQKMGLLQSVLIILLIVVVVISVYLLLHFLHRSHQQEGKINHSEKELEQRNRELISYTMAATQVNSVLNRILEIQEEEAVPAETRLSKIREELKMLNMRENGWKVFRTYFEQVHKSFFSKLNSKHPDLTAGEVRMCAFIVMNLTTKEIAALTNRSFRTVDSIKYRLHKKLAIKGDLSTSDYLHQFLDT